MINHTKEVTHKLARKCITLALTGIFFAALYFAFKAVPMTYHLRIGYNNFMVTESQLTFVQMQVLRFADSNDTVKIHIHSPGGYVVSLVEWVNRIEMTEAHTIAINEGIAASAAAVLSIVCDEQQADPKSFYLFHRSYSHGSMGQKELTKPDRWEFKLVTGTIYLKAYPFFTAEERALYNLGGDVWISGDDWMRRISK